MPRPSFRQISASIPLLLLPAAGLKASAEEPRASGIEWREDRILPRFAAARKLDVADLLRQPGEMRLLLASLQGLVNRSEPRIFLLEPAEEGPRTWLESLDLPTEEHRDPLDLVAKYRAELAGLIVYDPELPATVNLATTLAGIRGALVASPHLAEVLSQAPYDLEVLDDLRGRFQSGLEAYTWQFETLWPEVDPRLLIGLPPGRDLPLPDRLPEGFTVVAEEETREREARNRGRRDLDLGAWRGADQVYLRFQDAHPQDGWGAAVGRVTLLADGRTLADFTAGTESERPFLHDAGASQTASGGGFRFADGNGHFTYRLPLPADAESLVARVELWNQFRVSAGDREPRVPWTPFGHLRDHAVANRAMVFWLDANDPAEGELFERILAAAAPGAPYLGWFGNDVVGEVGAVETTSRHAIPVVPADWFNNLTVFSGARPARDAARPAPPAAPVLENRIYVTCTFSEGDNLQYNQHRMRRLWDDPARGQVPLNWTISPLLADAAPSILEHYQRGASAKDLLVAGPSGAGYFYPAAWPEERLADFLKSGRPYLEALDARVIHLLNRAGHEDLPLDARIAGDYRDHLSPSGLLLGWGDEFGLELGHELPIANVRGVGSVDAGRAALREAGADWDGSEPRFLALGLFAWSLGPADAVELARTAGPEFRFVRADHFFELIEQARRK